MGKFDGFLVEPIKVREAIFKYNSRFSAMRLLFNSSPYKLSKSAEAFVRNEFRLENSQGRKSIPIDSTNQTSIEHC